MSPAARYRAACHALGLPVWRPGMRSIAARPAPLEPVCSRAPDDLRGWTPYPGAEPDLGDPATVGCLLAAVRDALCAAYPAAERIDLHLFDDGQVNLGHDYGIGVVSGTTLADALIAALEAAAARRGGQP